MELSKLFLWASLAVTSLALPKHGGGHGDNAIEETNDNDQPVVVMRDGVPAIYNPFYMMAPPLPKGGEAAGRIPNVDPNNVTKPYFPPSNGGDNNNDEQGHMHNPCDMVRCRSGAACIVEQGRPKCVYGTTCGPSLCTGGTVCCNRSCGICTPPGGMCIQIFCESRLENLPSVSPAGAN